MSSLFRKFYTIGAYHICACRASASHYIPQQKSVYDHEVIRKGERRSGKEAMYLDIHHYYVPKRIRISELILFDTKPNNEIQCNELNKEFLEALPVKSEKYVSASTSLDKGIIPQKHLEHLEENSTIIENRAYNTEEWNEILNDYGSDYTVNARLQGIMQFLLAYKLPPSTRYYSSLGPRSDKGWVYSDLVQSFLNFMLSDDEIFQVSQVTLKFFVNHCIIKGAIDAIVDLHLKTKNRIDVYSPYFSASLLVGLSTTDMYDDVHNLFQKHMAATEVLSQKLLIPTAFNCLGICALKNGKHEVALQCLTALATRQAGLNEADDYFLEAFFNKFCYSTSPKVWEENREIVFAFFNMLHKHQLVLPSERIMNVVRNWFRSIKDERWGYKTLNVLSVRKPVCPITGVSLVPASLTEEEYGLMKNILLQSLMKKMFQDVHIEQTSKYEARMEQESTESSVLEFLEFLLHNGPFDLVMDGLNVVYRESKIRRDYNGLDKFHLGFNSLYSSIRQLRRRSKKNLKVMIPFREHMRPFLTEFGDKIHQVADVVFVANRVADDAFCFYATICSGPNCLLVSQDLFRDYKSFLANELGQSAALLFHKYQRSRQIDIVRVGNHNWKFRGPNVIDLCIQRTENTWHFPYIGDQQKRTATASDAKSMLCLYRR